MSERVRRLEERALKIIKQHVRELNNDGESLPAQGQSPMITEPALRANT
ncbi:MAG: hypothetical protein HQ503_10195 [Rhodospirillales bacterium]|nr:hypothetical protein [Rhodospirillales bacterium]